MNISILLGKGEGMGYQFNEYITRCNWIRLQASPYNIDKLTFDLNLPFTLEIYINSRKVRQRSKVRSSNFLRPCVVNLPQ